MSDDLTQRDERGRFLAGHAPTSPGRPPRATEQEYLSELKQTFPPAELAAKLRRALEMAEAQNSPRAMATVAELILSYTLGKPRQSLQVSSGDNNELLLALLTDRTPLLPPRQGTIDVLPVERPKLARDD